MDRKTESVSRPDGKKGVRAGRIYIRYAAAFGILTGLLLILTVWNINSGSIHISVRDILQILFQRQGEDAAYNIVWEIRLPRILAALILGGALSVSGFLLQTFFNNPIAGPFVLGISSGANLIGSILLADEIEDNVVTVFADDNKKYLSTDLFKDINNDNKDFISNKVQLISYEFLRKFTFKFKELKILL